MKCGMGNWIDISEQYIKTKTPEDCEDHYFTFYYKSKENNLPTNDDVIIQGARKITKDTIEVPINSNKADESLTRVKAFHSQREKDTQLEEEELNQRN